MTSSEVEINIINPRRIFSPSQRNSVVINVKTKDEEIFVDQSNGQETSLITRVSPTYSVNRRLRCSCHDCISSLLRNSFTTSDWLLDIIVPKISETANAMGFGDNGVTFTMDVTVTHRTKTFISVESIEKKPLRLVLLGMMQTEELKMETESCSICLDMFSGRNELTKMTCSHVFHTHCLLVWVQRKNTCPLCGTILYDH